MKLAAPDAPPWSAQVLTDRDELANIRLKVRATKEIMRGCIVDRG